MKYGLEDLYNGIKVGNKMMLSKAITLIESRKEEHQKLAQTLLSKIMPFTGNSIRIGVTGIPGVGKSTFIESFGKLAISKGHHVAVLAIDPSSERNKGSILGDKTRMEDLAKEDFAFIRPSPTSGFLGGISHATYESMLLCEAAGYDLILVETVGIGQSETLVKELTDVFILLKILGGGDQLQGIKRGVMEMVDLVFLNKINKENMIYAQKTVSELKQAFSYLPSEIENWSIPVLTGSALKNTGILELYQQVEKFVTHKKAKNFFENARQKQAEKRFHYWIQHLILQEALKNKNQKGDFIAALENVIHLKANPSSEAQKWIDEILNKTI